MHSSSRLQYPLKHQIHFGHGHKCNCLCLCQYQTWLEHGRQGTAGSIPIATFNSLLLDYCPIADLNHTKKGFAESLLWIIFQTLQCILVQCFLCGRLKIIDICFIRDRNTLTFNCQIPLNLGGDENN